MPSTQTARSHQPRDPRDDPASGRSLSVLARDLMEACGRDREAAAERLLQEAADDPEIMTALLKNAAMDAVNRVVIETRDLVWTPPTKAQLEGQSARVRALAAGNLFTFPLPGGQLLGDATREEVAEAAEFYGRQAADMGWKSRWLSAIASALPNSRVPVKKALKIDDLEKFKAATA